MANGRWQIAKGCWAALHYFCFLLYTFANRGFSRFKVQGSGVRGSALDVRCWMFFCIHHSTFCIPWVRVASRWPQPGFFVHRGAAYCVMSGSRLPCILRATAPFVYVRLHGPDHEHLYGGSYSDEDLRWWADRLQEWQAQQLDVFVYFNNDYGGNAVRNAGTMRALLGL